MALIECPECKAQISDKAASCPHCGAPKAPKPPAWKLENNLPKSASGARITIAVILGIVVLLVVVQIFIPKPPEPTAEQKRQQMIESRLRSNCDEFSARYMAEKFVQKHLKAPSTAKFNTKALKMNVSDDCRFWVDGSVDSQNSYGAMLRATFSMRLIYDPQADTWQAIDFNLQ